MCSCNVTLNACLSLQSTSRGKLAVRNPTRPQAMQPSEADETRDRVLGMLQSITSPLPATAGPGAETFEAPHPSSSPPSSSAAPLLLEVDTPNSGQQAASDLAASSGTCCGSGSAEVGGSRLLSPSKHEDGSSAEAAQGTVEARAARLAMLQYKQGRLSKNGLLRKVAQARAAGIAEGSSDASPETGAPAVSAVEDGLID